MNVYEIFDWITIDGEVRFLEWDEETETKTEIDRQTAWDRTILYMYAEENTLVIEVARDDD